MLYLTCTTITSVDLAHYGVSRAKDWVFVDCGTNAHRYKTIKEFNIFLGSDKPRLLFCCSQLILN